MRLFLLSFPLRGGSASAAERSGSSNVRVDRDAFLGPPLVRGILAYPGAVIVLVGQLGIQLRGFALPAAEVHPAGLSSGLSAEEHMPGWGREKEQQPCQ
jgi:hypothetical protein